jgi:hypothetical protein
MTRVGMKQDSGAAVRKRWLWLENWSRRQVCFGLLFEAGSVLKSRHFFHNLTPFPSARDEIINDLAVFSELFQSVPAGTFVRARREHATCS